MGRFLNADDYASTGQGFLGFNMFAYCLNKPVNMADYAGESGEIIDLGRGWKCRIDPANENTGTQRHIHIWKNGESYAQNDDGSPHDQGSNKSGKLSRWLQKTIEKKTGWDYNGKRDSFYSQTEATCMAEGVYYHFADGKVVYRQYSGALYGYFSIAGVEAAYKQSTNFDIGTSIYVMPVFTLSCIPSFSINLNFALTPVVAF